MGIPQQGCCARNLHPPDPTSHSSSGLWGFDAVWLNLGTEQPPSQRCPPLYQSYAEPKKHPVTPEQPGIPKKSVLCLQHITHLHNSTSPTPRCPGSNSWKTKPCAASLAPKAHPRAASEEQRGQRPLGESQLGKSWWETNARHGRWNAAQNSPELPRRSVPAAADKKEEPAQPGPAAPGVTLPG